MKILATIVLLSFLCGCKERKSNSSHLLSKEKMQVVMWDIINANSYSGQFLKKNSLKNLPVENMKMQQQIFKLHNVSREDFYESYNYYSSEPELMRVLLDSIIAKGERDKIKWIEKYRGGVR